MLVREYKKEDLDGVAKVHVDAWISTYSGMIPREYLISRTYEKQQKKWNDRLFNNKNTDEFMFVLENEDKEVVGFATAIINDEDSNFDSTLYTIYILKEYQGKGFGRMLIKAVTEKLVSLGAKSMILFAFANNCACEFYEHLGGKKGNSSIINISGVDLIEVEYYWNEINHLTI